uniref:Uncharacterized protein n=1 Tax=Peronospora matthiolae TaxID=2874970 RepID=A0AAV1T4I5_9STRA
MGKHRRHGPSLTSSEEEDTSTGEDETLVNLSGSRSSSRRRASNPAAQHSAGPSPDPIVIDTPSPSHDPPPPVDPVIPTVTIYLAQNFSEKRPTTRMVPSAPFWFAS